MKGLDPIVLLDAVLGHPDNLGPWTDQLLAYSASTAPEPPSKKEKPSVSPPELADRLEPLTDLRATALLRRAFGDTLEASDVLERLADALRRMDEAAPASTPDRATPASTTPKTAARKARR